MPNYVEGVETKSFKCRNCKKHPLFNSLLVRIKRSSHRLRIHSAVYGRDRTQVNITEVLKKKVAADSLLVTASNDLGGDPCPGFRKTLTVDFCFDGTRSVREAKEGIELKLP